MPLSSSSASLCAIVNKVYAITTGYETIKPAVHRVHVQDQWYGPAGFNKRFNGTESMLCE